MAMLIMQKKTGIPPEVNGWLSSLGTASADQGNVVALDNAGNVIVASLYYTGPTDSYDFALIKFNSSGTLQWQRYLGGSGVQSPFGIQIDSSNDIYLSGHNTIFKYSSAGALQWQRNLPDVSQISLRRLGTGELIIAGATTTLGAGSNDGYVAKLSSDGTSITWEKTLGDGASQTFSKVAVDSSGNVYAIGGASSGGLIAKYDSNGNIQWQKSLSGGSSLNFYDIAIDDSDNIYVCGSYSPSGGALLVQYNSSGTVVAQKRMMNNGDRFVSVYTDSSGNVYLAGSEQSGSNHLLFKLDSSLVAVWSRSLTGAGTSGSSANEAEDIVTNAAGDVFISGAFYNWVEGSNDIVVARLPADGSKTGVHDLGGRNVTYAVESTTVTNTSLTEGTPTYTDQSVSATNNAGSLTDGAGALVQSYVVM